MISLVNTVKALQLNRQCYEYGKQAAEATATAALSGRLYLSKSGWLLLSVPNALVRGAFDAMSEPGIELPPSGPSGVLDAHISVMRPEELESIGGGNRISERGHVFHYNLGKIKTTTPAGWAEMSRVWFIEIKSTELEQLRKSYGLPPLPKYPFHLTVAVRRTNVLRNSDVSKAAETHPLMKSLGCATCPSCQKIYDTHHRLAAANTCPNCGEALNGEGTDQET